MPLNPGLSGTFPWLAQISDAYEQYRFRGLAFEFKSTASEYFSGATTQSMGTVVLATDYNASNPTFTSKRAMENYQYAVSGPPTRTMVHMVEVARGQTPIEPSYIRLGTPQENNYDLKTYDLGNFQIATTGNQIGPDPDKIGSIGELWVAYEIELLKPKYRTSGTRVDRYTISRYGINPSNYGTQEMISSRPFTNFLRFDHEQPRINTYVNGFFGIGTYITSSQDDGIQPTSGNYIHFPNASIGKTYRISVLYGGGPDATAPITIDNAPRLQLLDPSQPDSVSKNFVALTRPFRPLRQNEPTRPTNNTDPNPVAQRNMGLDAVIECKQLEPGEIILHFKMVTDDAPVPTAFTGNNDGHISIEIIEVPNATYTGLVS